MSIMAPLLAHHPQAPRLTVYDEAAGTRMEFSALTLDNWAAKIANMLDEEFELEPGATVLIDLPASWQLAVIALGVINSSRKPVFAGETDAAEEQAAPALVFTTVEAAPSYAAARDVVVVSPDPFGRGVIESGGQLPEGTVDFGPTVRFYGDSYLGDSPALAAYADGELGAHRYMVDPWRDRVDVDKRLLAPLAAGGSVVACLGLNSTERLRAIAEAENVTHYLSRE
ncbi:TIGR03089 family protein [Corynebacterium liangguodongii]|uniref:TIGR03089 family protein n=1 Tax=Corynebacterium liangguodongii TaxID=2079535 RepID=A0A2S0WCX8_9CORY|nr:TIGR03089 family protein [Corynebacterium liangguodongii]AWB83532.1 TIGR03089 family protein [Corynebacterium liangguodongii]PWC00378.1 TIGR03089 family protein [Corynebacterium liangguodongii]